MAHERVFDTNWSFPSTRVTGRRPNLPVHQLELQRDHTSEEVFCFVCGGQTVPTYGQYEIWGSKVVVIADRVPFHYCLACDMGTRPLESIIAFNEKALEILRAVKDRGYIRILESEMRDCRFHLNLFGLRSVLTSYAWKVCSELEKGPGSISRQ